MKARPKYLERSAGDCLGVGLLIFVTALVVSFGFPEESSGSVALSSASITVSVVTNSSASYSNSAPVSVNVASKTASLILQMVSSKYSQNSTVAGTSSASTLPNKTAGPPLAAMGVVATETKQTTSAGSEKSAAGILVPLFTQPIDGSWQELSSVKESYPGVPITAIINPDSGPGSAASPRWASGIAGLEAAGITVVGYVATGYGEDPIGAVEAQIQSYSSWYKLDGVFFDKMANSNGTGACPTNCTLQQYYRDLSNFAGSVGLATTIGNPGTNIDPSFEGIMNVLVICENMGKASAGFIQSSTTGYNRSDFACISIGVGFNGTQEKLYSNYVGWIYMTDYCSGESVSVCNPYDGLPSYFSSLVSNLAG